jgi:hypothetical protein
LQHDRPRRLVDGFLREIARGQLHSPAGDDLRIEGQILDRQKTRTAAPDYVHCDWAAVAPGRVEKMVPTATLTGGPPTRTFWS